jgi:zinc transporter
VSTSVRASESTYGSDKAGLVWAYTFSEGRAGSPVDSAEAAAWMASPSGGRGDDFIWLHFDLSNAATERWLREHLALPEAFYDSLRETTSTRVELSADAILAVLHDVRFFTFDVSDAATVTLYADARAIVSARVAPLRSLDRLRSSIKAGESFRSTAEILAHLLRDQADVLVQIVRDATTSVDVIEDRLINHQAGSRSQLGSTRRVLVRLQRLLAPEPAALFRLLNRPPAWMRPDDVRDLRQSAEELAAAVADSAALVERVRLLQEELMALVNEQTNRTLFVLTAVTVLALPMMIIPGLFGMNVGGVPFQRHSGFWIVVAIVVAVTASGALWVWARRRDS